MSKILSIACGAGLALAMALSTTAPSRADDAAAGIVGGMLGFMAGTAAANGGIGVDPGYHHHHHMSDWDQHVQDCQDAYGWRYDPDTDMVHSHYHVFPCDL